MRKTTRRELFAALAVGGAGTGLLTGYGELSSAQPSAATPDGGWRYVRLPPDVVAADAYRLMPDGGCMYGLFRAVVTAWGQAAGKPVDAFPFHLFRYGAGGIGAWGTVCGAANGAAALVGLFEKDSNRRQEIIGKLFTWYEQTKLPRYRPTDGKSGKMAACAARSVLCHVSLANWCKASGAAVLSAEVKERCRRLTADVAKKTVELLNEHCIEPAPTAALPPTAANPKNPPRSFGKMQCVTCHELGDQHPGPKK